MYYSSYSIMRAHPGAGLHKLATQGIRITRGNRLATPMRVANGRPRSCALHRLEYLLLLGLVFFLSNQAVFSKGTQFLQFFGRGRFGCRCCTLSNFGRASFCAGFHRIVTLRFRNQREQFEAAHASRVVARALLCTGSIYLFEINLWRAYASRQD
jgi:hypothetical protein